jgi:hypothetical protein
MTTQMITITSTLTDNSSHKDDSMRPPLDQGGLIYCEGFRYTETCCPAFSV